MKVLFVNNLYPPHELGGGGKSLEKLCRAFPAVGIEPVVVSLHPGTDRIIEDVGDTTVYRLPLANCYWPFTEQGHPRLMRPLFNTIDRYNPLMGSRVKAVVEEESPDLVRTKNLYGFSTAVWNACREAGAPVVHTLGDYYLICLHASLTREGAVCDTQCGECELWTAGQSARSHRVDGVTGVSRFVLDKHETFGYFQATDHREVVPPPMDPIDAPAAASEQRSAPLRLGYLGRLEPDKGVDLLVSAVANISGSEVRLMVGGEGPANYEHTLFDKGDHENIEFRGHVDPVDFLRKIDLLAVPSRIPETFGRVVVEAFRQDVPVMSSGRGALGDLIEDGENGWLVDELTVESWEEAIRRILRDPDRLDEVSGRGRDVVERCRTDRVVERYQSLFQSVLDGSTTGGTT